MAETIPDLRKVPKARAYAELQGHLDAILDGVDDEVATMPTIAALLHHSLGHLWTGFYRVVEPGQLLRVGPYQGIWLSNSVGRGVVETPQPREKRDRADAKYPGTSP